MIFSYLIIISFHCITSYDIIFWKIRVKKIINWSNMFLLWATLMQFMLFDENFSLTPFYSNIDLSCKICLHMNNNHDDNNKGRVHFYVDWRTCFCDVYYWCSFLCGFIPFLLIYAICRPLIFHSYRDEWNVNAVMRCWP